MLVNPSSGVNKCLASYKLQHHCQSSIIFKAVFIRSVCLIEKILRNLARTWKVLILRGAYMHMHTDHRMDTSKF